VDPDLSIIALQTPSNAGLIAGNWTIFTDAFNAIDVPLENGVNGIIEAMLAYVQHPLQVLAVVTIIITLLMTLYGPKSDSMDRLVMVAIGFAFVITVLASLDTYNRWIGTPISHMPEDLGNKLIGVIGGAAVHGGEFFDNIWNKSMQAGLIVYRSLPDTIRALPLYMAVWAFWALALITIGRAFLIYVVSFVVTKLIISVGPLPLATAPMKRASFLFSGWLSALAGAVLAQILVIALLALTINIETAQLAKITAAQGDTANPINMLQALAGIAALLYICEIVLKQVPQIASGISHGVFMNTNQYLTTRVAGMPSVSQMPGAVGSAAASAARSVNQIGITSPAAPSLSRVRT